jgi:putative oxidoreductase
MIQPRRIAVWVGAIALAAAFVAVGVSKLEGISAMRWSERFRGWGYPANASYLVGVFEIAGGLGVLFPRWRRAASLTLGALMIGALCTHLLHFEFPRVIPPLVLGGLAFLMYGSHGRTAGTQTFHRKSGM